MPQASSLAFHGMLTMPTHKTQLGWLQTALSIIELNFSTPFTKDGPPESISNLWVKYLKRIEEDEVVDWITWGHDVGTPNKVCVLVGMYVPGPFL